MQVPIRGTRSVTGTSGFTIWALHKVFAFGLDSMFLGEEINCLRKKEGSSSTHSVSMNDWWWTYVYSIRNTSPHIHIGADREVSEDVMLKR